MATSQTNTLQQIEQWHKDARPIITNDTIRMALAVHIEEFLEMLAAIDLDSDEYDLSPNTALAVAEHSMKLVMTTLKNGNAKVLLHESQRQNFLDGLADQIVTAVGCGVAVGMNVPEAVNRVQISNDSKRCPNTGKFFFDEQGKITKPDWYQRPDLTGLY